MFNKNLYQNKYHKIDLSSFSFLITGGAGFIGSNLVEYLLRNNAGHVRVFDNLSNGYFDNIKDFISLPNFEFIFGDIRDYNKCCEVVDGIDFISHQAALGSVPRSIEDPILTNSVNIGGFLNILNAAKDSKTLKGFVYAASSSTYGDSIASPKTEGNEGSPLSPYAVTKAVNELYGDVFGRIYNFKSIGLRYFNVFGPKQNPNNPYAAVIPIFCKAIINNERPIINGDSSISRDFTFIENVIQANIIALLYNYELKSSDSINNHEVFNVACGQSTSLEKLISYLADLEGIAVEPIISVARKGDIKASLASIDKIKKIGYNPLFQFEEGLRIVYEWYKYNSKY